MEGANPKVKKRVQQIQELIKGGNFAIAKFIFDLEDKIDAEVPEIKNIIARLKGDKGDNYVITDQDKKDIAAIATRLIDKDGIGKQVLNNIDFDNLAKAASAYIKVENGKPGHTPTDKELAALIEPLIPELPIEEVVKQASNSVLSDLKQLIPTTEDLLNQVPQFGEKVRDSLELLRDEDRLDKSAIKGLDDFDKRIKKVENAPVYLSGVQGIQEIVAGTNIIVDKTNPKYPKISSTGGGGGGVTSFNTRTGAVTLTSGDVTGALGYTPYSSSNPSNYISLGSLSNTAPITYNSTTGAIGITQATTSTNGYLSSTDWNTFNGKQNAFSAFPSTQLLYGNGTSTPATSANLTYDGKAITSIYNDNNFAFGLNVQNNNTGIYALTGIGLNNSSSVRVGQFVYTPSNYADATIAGSVLFSSVGNNKLAFVADAGNTYTPDIYFKSGGNTPAIYIQGSTNYVGVGPTNPDSKLHVGTSNTGLRVGYLGTSTNYYDADTQYFRNGSASTTYMTMNSTAVAVNGTLSGGNGTYPIKLQAFSGHTSWIDMPAVAGSASGIGSGGPGANPWVAFAGASGQWFTNAALYDICYRNTSGRLLFGNTAGYASVILSSDALYVRQLQLNSDIWHIDLQGNQRLHLQSTGAGGNSYYETAGGSHNFRGSGDTDLVSITNVGRVGIGTVSPNSYLHTVGSVATAYVAKTSAYTLTVNDYTVETTSGTFALTLPTSVGITGRIYVLKNTGTGIITINTTSSQTIDGNASGVLTMNQYDSYTLQSNGSNWIII